VNWYVNILLAEFVDECFADIFVFGNVSMPRHVSNRHTGWSVVVTALSACQRRPHSDRGQLAELHSHSQMSWLGVTV